MSEGYLCFGLGGRFGVGNRGVRRTTLLDANFAAMPLGGHAASAFQLATGLRFTRASTSTVQTSDSALTPALGVDVACIGNRTSDDTKRGLVIQHNVQNLLAGTNSPRDLDDGWTAGTGTVDDAYAAGPDGIAPGIGCSRATVSSGQYSSYGNIASSARRCFSSWQRSVNAGGGSGDMQMGWILAAAGDGLQAVRSASDTWARLSLPNLGASLQYFTVCDGRDYSGSGGQTARARDVLADYIQYEAGDFPTEAIPTAATRRSCDVLSHSSASSLCHNGRFEFYAKFSPKHASTMTVLYDGSGGTGTAAGWYLWSNASGSDYAYIKSSDKKLYLKVAGGSEISSTNAISFAQYDVVEIEIRVGASAASVARYRKNSGPWHNLVLATVAGIMAPTGSLTFFSNAAGTVTADSGQLPCWLHRLTITRSSEAPGFDFSQEPFTMYFSDYAAAPWTGIASASTSGSFNLVAGSAPAVGANFGTHPSADFDGTAHYLSFSGTNNDAFTTAAWYFAAVVSIDAYAADAVGAEYNQDAIIMDSGTIGGTVSTSGFQAFQYGAVDGKIVTAYVAMPSAGTKAFVEAWFDGTELYVAVNGTTSAGATVDDPDVAFLSATPRVAVNYDDSAFTDGKIALLIARKTVPDAATRAAYLAKVRSDYGVP